MVTKAVFSLSFRAIRIWLYSKKPSMNENRACPVQISVVDTHSHFTIFLGDWNYVGYPFWILCHFQESYIELLLDFFFNLQEHFWFYPSELLLNWLAFWPHRQLMFHYLCAQTRHILIGPSENVYIFFEEIHNFLFYR